jgi:hypothetical protein
VSPPLRPLAGALAYSAIAPDRRTAPAARQGCGDRIFNGPLIKSSGPLELLPSCATAIPRWPGVARCARHATADAASRATARPRTLRVRLSNLPMQRLVSLLVPAFALHLSGGRDRSDGLAHPQGRAIDPSCHEPASAQTPWFARVIRPKMVHPISALTTEDDAVTSPCSLASPSRRGVLISGWHRFCA